MSNDFVQTLRGQRHRRCRRDHSHDSGRRLPGVVQRRASRGELLPLRSMGVNLKALQGGPGGRARGLG